MVLIGGSPEDGSESPGTHHGWHGNRTAVLASALPSFFPGARPRGERVPMSSGGIECAGENPRAGVRAEPGGVYD
eukprot:9107386-Heterocapsa_arctica.AAC.1